MMSFLSQAGLILLSAFLLAFSHPWSPPIISRSQNLIADHGLQALLAWIGLLPFLLLAKRLKGGRLFAAALGLSFAYFFLSLFWINNAIVIYGNLNLLVSFAMTGGLSLLMGSMWAFGLFWGILAHRHTGLRLSITLPICVVAWEFIRNYFFTGFPWQNLAYSQHYNAPVLQTASLWGIYGINFMLILSNAVLYELIQWRRTKQKEDFPRYSVALLVGLVGFSYAYGVVMMHVNDRREAAAPRLKAALIQGNIDQDTKNDSYRFAYRILDVYQGLTLQVPDDVDLVIWPEAAYPFNVPHGSTHMSRVFSRPNSTWPSRLPWHMLIGIPTYERLPNLKKYFNSAFLLDPDMKVLGSFDKSHLVPFGEYVPFHKFIDVNKIVPGAGMFYPGTLGQGLSFGDYRFGALICYEGIFPKSRASTRISESSFLLILPTTPGTVLPARRINTWPSTASGPSKRARPCCAPPTPVFRLGSTARAVFASAPICSPARS